MENIEKYYKLSAAEVLQKLKVRDTGLNQPEVEDSRKKYGPNIIKEGANFSIWKLFWAQLSSPLVYILVFASFLTFSINHYIDSGIIICIVIFNVVVGFFQEYRAENATKILKKLLIYKAKVLRDNKEKIINSEDLVPGDILIIRAGDRISADARIIKSQNLRVNEAVLTGESNLIEKTSDNIGKETILAERNNMLFSGTSIISGEGEAVVVSIGETTEFGKIAKSMLRIKKILTPFQIRMNLLGSWIVRIVLTFIVLIIILGLLRGFDFLEMVLIAISTVVAAIPEGLPTIITIILAIGVMRMAKHNAIIRKLAGVETLGSISVIASDKTGTLTCGEMTVTKIFTGGEIYNFSGSGYDTVGEIYLNSKKIKRTNSNLNQLLRVAVACSDARVYMDQDKQIKTDGDPTEAALVVAAEKNGINKTILDNELCRIGVLPFETEKHYMATLHKSKNHKLLAVKGTIEKILSVSDRYYDNGKILPFTEEKKSEILRTNNIFAKDALRVLAVAYREDSEEKKQLKENDIKNLIFLGIVGMIDTPRKEVYKAINDAKSAGIRVLMITGDHKLTATAIAKRLDLIQNEKEVMDGEELTKISEEKLSEKLEHIQVFARISPTDKLKIVKTLQDKGEVVSVTGDGVNDAPALKAADIGIAMGKSGTEVARESSDLVLADDNFSTIINAVEEGRVVVHNMRRNIVYVLPMNGSEISTIFLALAMGFPSPFSAIQILWINVITEGTSGIALAMEPKHPDILNLPPQPKNVFMRRRNIQQIIIMTVVMILGVLGFYIWALKQNHSLEYARTGAFGVMVFLQIFNIMNAQSLHTSIFKYNYFRNPYVLISIFISVSLFFLTISTRIGQEFFHTTNLDVTSIFIIICIAVLVIPAIELEKYIWRKRHGRDY